MTDTMPPLRLLDRGSLAAQGHVGIATAAHLLASGEVVAIPTDTVYGLAAAIDRPDAIAGIFRIKGRDGAKNLPVLIADPAAASGVCTIKGHERLWRLATSIWPGALTVAFPAVGATDARLIGPDGTIGLRVPDDPVARALIRKMEVMPAARALAVTSANRSGLPALTTAEDVNLHLGSGAHPLRWVLDGGSRTRQQPSTVIGERDGELVIYREGALPTALLWSLWQELNNG